MGMSKREIAWWRLGPQHVLAIALFVALFAMSAREIVDPDFWWHLATGRYIVETRSIPSHDVFSYTVTDHKWITHEWLTQVGMIGLYRVGGSSALLLATCAVITLAFGFVYLQCDVRPHLAVFAVLLAALASAVTWGTRPQMLNVLMMALFTYLLDRYRAAQERVLWLFPVLTALWVNMHSGYFLGFVAMGLVIAGEWVANLVGYRTSRTLALPQVRDLAIALAASVIASLLNPNGYKMLWYPFETLGSQAMQQYIQEWASPDFHRPAYWPLALLLLGGAAAMVFSRRKRDLTDVLSFFGFGLASLLSARHIPLFAVVAAPIWTRYAAQIEVGRLHWDLIALSRSRRPWRWEVVVNWGLVLFLLLGGGLRVAGVLIENRDVEGRHYPLEALKYIAAHGLAAKRMYNSYNWGGYLLWRGYKVFIDGRADVYLDDFMDEYVLAYQLRGDWRRPLDRYGVDYVLIERDASFALLLEASEEWTRAYDDDVAVIFVRAEGER
jgi:hypothetical protein